MTKNELNTFWRVLNHRQLELGNSTGAREALAIASSSDELDRTQDASDRDYHYGVAPRVGLALRLIAGDNVSADLSADKYLLGRIANRSAGRDDITRVDAALTWRLSGRHAIGLRYVWSHRAASYPVIGDRSQTLSTVGLYYTLLGLDGLGSVDWRPPH